jgi:hypothetical protein
VWTDGHEDRVAVLGRRLHDKGLRYDFYVCEAGFLQILPDLLNSSGVLRTILGIARLLVLAGRIALWAVALTGRLREGRRAKQSKQRGCEDQWSHRSSPGMRMHFGIGNQLKESDADSNM